MFNMINHMYKIFIKNDRIFIVSTFVIRLISIPNHHKFIAICIKTYT